MRAATERSPWEKLFGPEGSKKRGPRCVRGGTTNGSGDVGRNKTPDSAVLLL